MALTKKEIREIDANVMRAWLADPNGKIPTETPTTAQWSLQIEDDMPVVIDYAETLRLYGAKGAMSLSVGTGQYVGRDTFIKRIA